MRRAALRGGLALAGGAAVGAGVRSLADGPSPAECASAAATVVLAAAVVLGASTPVADGGLGGRLLRGSGIGAVAAVATVAAAVAAGGGAGAVGAAVVAAAWAVLAHGLRGLLALLRTPPEVAAYASAGLALLPAALLFVADPWIDWRGGTPESPGRAARVLNANPLAAMTSHAGGLGTDFQRMPLLYDGPGPGVPGLSLVGQYYPSVPPTPFAWGAVAGGFGAVLVAASRVRR